MNQPRYDVYGAVHKGIRFLMTEVMYDLGKSDVNSSSELTSLEEKLRYLWEVLKAHAAGEEEFLFPHLERGDETIFTKLKEAHQEAEKQIEILKNDFKTILETKMGDDEKTEHFSKFTKQYNSFLAFYSSHLQDEELDANPILWRALSDEDLMVIIPKIAAMIPPEIMQYFMSYFLRAINHTERLGLLVGMKKNLPEPAFKGILNIAESSLKEPDWLKLKQALEKVVQVH